MNGLFLALNSTNANTGTPDNFTINYPNPGLKFGKDGNDLANFEVALISATVWYTYYNISAENGNNYLTYFDGSDLTTYDVTIPDGIYEIADINAYLQSVIKTNDPTYTGSGIVIAPNFNTLHVQIYADTPATVATPANTANWSINLAAVIPAVPTAPHSGQQSTIYDILGFSATSTNINCGTLCPQTGANQADITNGVNNLLIHTSIAEGSYINGQASDIVGTLAPAVPPGSLIIYTPPYPIYVPFRKNLIVNTIQMYVTDQNGNPIDFNGNPTSYLMHVRKVSGQ